jgi:ribosome maturation factor RimP
LIKEDLIKELNKLFSDSLSQEGLELVDLIFRNDANKLILRILVDKPTGGITLGECARVNRKLGDLLEEKDLIVQDYVLEVASPGLDRQLKSEKDFSRCTNKEVVFYLNDLIDGKCQWQGVVSKVDLLNVFIDNLGVVLEIPLIKINKARLVI